MCFHTSGVAPALPLKVSMRTMLATEPVRMVRWVFQRGENALTCEVDHSQSTYDVCVVPHWDVSAAVVEEIDSPTDALQRHAEIVQYLRETGWSLTSRS
jgi:hypothetical protein